MRKLPPLIAALALATTSALAQPLPPLPEDPNANIGYPSVAAALSALRARTDVVPSVQNGWMIIEDRAAMTIWSFAPATDPSFPAVVKRTIVEQGGNVTMNMKVSCEATKAACDDLVRRFVAMNEAITRSMSQPRPQPQSQSQ